MDIFRFYNSTAATSAEAAAIPTITTTTSSSITPPPQPYNVNNIDYNKLISDVLDWEEEEEEERGEDIVEFPSVREENASSTTTTAAATFAFLPVLAALNSETKLLMQNVIFFDDKRSKYVNVGWLPSLSSSSSCPSSSRSSSQEFQATLELRDVKSCSIFIDQIDWCSLMLLCNNINKYFNDENHKRFYSVIGGNVEITHVHLKKMKHLKFKRVNCHNNYSVILSKSEWESLLELKDIVNSLLCSYAYYSNTVKLYYKTYLEKCKFFNCIALGVNEFFIPNDILHVINYERLFYEIPIVCSEKILNDINNIRE